LGSARTTDVTAHELTTIIDDPAARAGVSAESVVEAFLDRIAEWQPHVNAFVTVTPELALKDARRVDIARDRGEPIGPLDGLVLAIKDDVDVGGVRCTVGSRFYSERFAEEDAEVVRRLRAAGGVVIGKAGLHEWAYGATSNNPHYGPVRNAWDWTRIPGGSSGGSASAVAADLCMGAIGSDAGGSVRVPAALNGVSGLRPTTGAISGIGSHAICWSFEVIGPIARSVRDVAIINAVMTGFDRRDSHSRRSAATEHYPAVVRDNDRIRIGIPSNFFFENLDPEVDIAVREGADQLRALGADLIDVALPGAEDAYEAARSMVLAEALAIQEQRLIEHPELFGEDVRRRLQLGREVSGVDFARSMETVRSWCATVRDAFEAVDLILTPTTTTPAPLIASAEMIETTAMLTRLTWPWSAARTPAISLACGVTAAGPIGLQLAARPWNESILLEASLAYQESTDWHRLRPPSPGTVSAKEGLVTRGS
jgi:aspartyl-tRNA(Asn)/glutamyl-tRNA(Gln) amidotransferase subunit A